MAKLSCKLVLVCLFTFGSFAAQAEKIAQTVQLGKSRTMAITNEPLKLLGLTGAFKYGIRLADFVALTVPFQITSLSSEKFNANIFEIGGGVGARFFLSGPAYTSSWYIEPVIKAAYWRATAGGKASTALAIPELHIGYAWVLDSGLTIDLGGGFGYAMPVGTDKELKAQIDKLSVGQAMILGFGARPSLDFAIGYAW